MMAITLGGTSVIMEHFDAEEFLQAGREAQGHPVAAGADHVRAHAETARRGPAEIRRLVAERRDPRRGALPGRRQGAHDRLVGTDPDRVLRRLRRQRRHRLEFAAVAVASRHRRQGRGRQASRSSTRTTRKCRPARSARCISPTRRCSRYHNDPEKTKRAYNARGWSTLGDVGYVDDEGFLYLTDRKSYMIISGGVNIYPQETEDVLITHPDIADVAVFGVPNEEMGEEVKAVVQPHDMSRAGKALEAELIAVLPQAPVADQVPEEHRLRARTAAHAHRQAGEAPSARQILAEEGNGVSPRHYFSPRSPDERSDIRAAPTRPSACAHPLIAAPMRATMRHVPERLPQNEIFSPPLP